MPANYILLGEVTVGAATASSVTFSNIPQTGYTDLKIAISARTNSGATRTDIRWYYNSDTSGNNYSYKRALAVDGITQAYGVNSGNYTDAGTAINGNGATSNTFSNFELYIPDYAGSRAKSASGDWVAENNSGSSFILGINSYLWNQTAAISSITFSPAGGAIFSQYSTFYLYGIAAVGTTPVIAPFASGGDIIQNDGTYWIHTFLSSGTFTPVKSLTCDYLVVAGGGAGGSGVGEGGGGGGAGGFRTATGFSASSGISNTVTIGAGGVAGTGSNNSTNGSDSVFSTITATGGGKGGGDGLNAGSGGSGGGSSYAGSVGSGNTPSTSPSQGNNGGAGLDNFPSPGTSGGGGGGASAVGATGRATGTGNGGAGTASSITGSSVTYAGGGGGGQNNTTTVSTGGAGGGGNGATNAVEATAGTANTGGGGGGQMVGANTRRAKNGGSGIVIIRYPIAS
jgi:hypothetical protein